MVNLKIFLLSILVVLAGCDSQDKNTQWRSKQLEKTFNTTAYNYTGHNIADIRFSRADASFKIEDAASADSIYLRNASKTVLGNGDSVFYSSASCCFYFNKINKPFSLKIIWQVVYDLDLFEGESGRFDHRTSKNAAPGSLWCEAIVPLRELYPKEADNLRLHFLRDGTVVALLGDVKEEQPLPVAEVTQHGAALAKGRYCVNEVDNPWYGIPHKPHRE